MRTIIVGSMFAMCILPAIGVIYEKGKLASRQSSRVRAAHQTTTTCWTHVSHDLLNEKIQ